MIAVAAWDPGVQLLAVRQAGSLTSGFAFLYCIFTDRLIIYANFRKIIEDVLQAVGFSTAPIIVVRKHLLHRILDDS